MEPRRPLDEDEELDALLDDAADGIDGHEMMKEDENNNNNKTHTCENIGHETKQALSNQEKAFDPLAGNGKKARKKRRQRKGKDSTTSGGGNATPAETDELRGEDARRENDEANGNGSPCGTKTESHAAFTKPEGGGVKKREEEEEEEERRRSGASAAAAGSLNRGAHASDNGSAGGDDAGVQNLVKRLRQIQTDARSAAGDSGADAAFGDAANMAEAGDSEEALASMLEQLASAVSAEGGDSDSDGMQSLVDAMMGQLLSKEVLYKPMMEIRDKCVRHSHHVPRPQSTRRRTQRERERERERESSAVQCREESDLVCFTHAVLNVLCITGIVARTCVLYLLYVQVSAVARRECE